MTGEDRRHQCHALGCTTAVAPTLLMCPPHWRLVPAEIKARVREHYRAGQCFDRRLITPQWRQAARAAIDAVHAKERP